MLEHYELMFIVPGSVDESQVSSVKEKVIALLNEAGAKISLQESQERKKLAYDIKHETYGYYQLVQFDLEKSQMKELEQKLQLNTDILRFLLTKAVVKTAADLAEEEKIKEKIRAKQAESVKQELKEAEAKAADEKKIEIKKEEDITKGKLSMEDLDKKLDEILGDNLKV